MAVPLRRLQSMGFAVAVEVSRGDEVVVGGAWRRVTAVRHEGKDWPYYEFAGDPGNWVSWQMCGEAQLFPERKGAANG